MKILRKFVYTVCLTLISCQIFRTREPEIPIEATNQSNWKQPVTPEVVIENFRNAIYDRSTENYIRCFVDSNFSNKRFTFIPTQEAQVHYSDIFKNWTLSSERNYFNNIKANIPRGAVSEIILFGNFQSFGVDSVVYYASYFLNFQHVVKDIPKIAKGNLQFYLTLDRNGNWAIYKWIDVKVQDEFSWSELKAKFSY